jgi:hypothetical protein
MFEIAITDAARIVGKSPRPMQLRAKNEGWQGTKVEGKKYQKYPLSYYPEDWQVAIAEKEGLSLYKEAGEMVGGAQPVDEAVAVDCEVVVDEPSPPSPLSQGGEGEPEGLHSGDWQLTHCKDFERPMGTRSEVRAAARALVLALVAPWCVRHRVEGQVDCEYRFCEAYGLGQVAVPDWVREHVRRVSRSTLHRWRQLRDQGSAGTDVAVGPLGGKHRSGPLNGIREDAELEKMVWGVLSEQTLAACGPRTVYRRLQRALPEEQCPSYAQVLRYLRWFQTECKVQFLTLVSPKDFRNKVAMAIGRLDQDLEPNQRWQLDFTRNDVLLELEGKVARFAVGMVLDVATRRRKVLLSPVPKGETTALLLLAAIEDWGMPTEIRPDNGREFINSRITTLCNTLGIIVNPCIPGKPQEKGNVEKALGDLVRRMEAEPSFVGHNVAQREQIRAAKGEQFLLENAPQFETFQRWLDALTEEIHQTAHTGVGMDGLSPNAKLAEFVAQGWRRTDCPLGETELRRLAYSAEVTARRDCVVWEGKRYITEHLALVSAGDKLRVAMDGNDLRRIHVYSLDMQNYYGMAKWEIAMSKAELIAAAQTAKRIQQGIVAGTKEAAKAGKRVVRELEKRPDLALSPTADLVAQQQVTEAVRVAMVAEAGTETAAAMALVPSPSQPSPPSPLSQGGEGGQEEPSRFKAPWHWFAFHYRAGNHEADPELRKHMAMELTSTGRDNITGVLSLDADAAYALGQEFGLSTTEADDLREGVLKKERAHKLWAEQRRRFA